MGLGGFKFFRKMKKVIKIIVAVLFILSAFGGIIKGEVLAGLCFLILGIIILPQISNKIKQSVKLFQSKGLRYVVYTVLFISGGLFIDRNGVDENSSNFIRKENKKLNLENSSGVVTIDGNGNEVSQKTNSEQNFNNVDWSSNFSQSELQGKWLQVLWFNPQNASEKIYYKDGDEEQKTLSLTSKTYQTSTETGGTNPEFKYQIKNNKMIVTTKSKLASVIYNYSIELSKDKKLLKLTGDYEARVYKKK